MKYLLLAIFLSLNANAWDKKPKLPDATPEQCKAQGKSFIKASVRKTGVHVRAYCRGKAGAK